MRHFGKLSVLMALLLGTSCYAEGSRATSSGASTLGATGSKFLSLVRVHTSPATRAALLPFTIA
jgi:hypothetical protein